MTMWQAIKSHLPMIDDVRREWRKVSTWLTAIGAALWGLFAAVPSLATEAWNALPQDLRGNIPHADWIASACFVAILVAKHVKQKGRGDA